MIRTSTKLCMTCKYGKWLKGWYNGEHYCDYLNMTGQSRKCPVGICDKYEKKDKSDE